jgi:hypothetical protein
MIDKTFIWAFRHSDCMELSNIEREGERWKPEIMRRTVENSTARMRREAYWKTSQSRGRIQPFR